MGLSEALGKSWDVVVLPGGGPGAAALAASPEVISPFISELRFEFLTFWGPGAAALAASPEVIFHPFLRAFLSIF